MNNNYLNILANLRLQRVCCLFSIVSFPIKKTKCLGEKRDIIKFFHVIWPTIHAEDEAVDYYVEE